MKNGAENIGLQSSGKISGGLDSKKAHSYIEIGRTGNLDIASCYLYEKNTSKTICSRDPEDAYQNIQILWT